MNVNCFMTRAVLAAQYKILHQEIRIASFLFPDFEWHKCVPPFHQRAITLLNQVSFLQEESDSNSLDCCFCWYMNPSRCSGGEVVAPGICRSLVQWMDAGHQLRQIVMWISPTGVWKWVRTFNSNIFISCLFQLKQGAGSIAGHLIAQGSEKSFILLLKVLGTRSKPALYWEDLVFISSRWDGDLPLRAS